jgi:hypothetical protein
MNEFLKAIMLTVHNGKGCPMTCLCRHRREVQVQIQPINNLGTRRVWMVSNKSLEALTLGKTGHPLSRRLIWTAKKKIALTGI